MSFDVLYPRRKDWRNRYYDSRQFDRSCRSHGSCPWCIGNRRYKRVQMVEELDLDYQYETQYEDDGQPDDHTELNDFAHDDDWYQWDDERI